MAHRDTNSLVEKRVTKSIVSILAVAGPARASYFATLFQILENIIKNPLCLKYRKFRLSNNTVQRRVLKAPPVLEFLLNLGFEFNEGHFTLSDECFRGIFCPESNLQDTTTPSIRWEHHLLAAFRHAKFLLQEAKKVAAAYPVGSGPHVQSASSPLSPSSLSQILSMTDFDTADFCDNFAEQFDDDPNFESHLQGNMTDWSSQLESEQTSATILNKSTDGHSVHARKPNSSTLVDAYSTESSNPVESYVEDANGTDLSEDIVQSLLRQRHAVASAFTAHQTRQRLQNVSDKTLSISQTNHHKQTSASEIDAHILDVGNEPLNSGATVISEAHSATNDDNNKHFTASVTKNLQQNELETVMKGIEREDTDVDWDKCDLCMDDIGVGAILPCCHLYCAVCIQRWLKESPTCPTCRLVCTLDDVQLLQPLEGEEILDTMMRLFQTAAVGAKGSQPKIDND